MVLCQFSQSRFRIVRLIGLPSVSGEVRWRRADSIGVHLANPLSPEALDSWIKHHGSGD